MQTCKAVAISVKLTSACHQIPNKMQKIRFTTTKPSIINTATASWTYGGVGKQEMRIHMLPTAAPLRFMTGSGQALHLARVI